MAKLKLSSPWVIYYQKLSAMFQRDQEVKIIFNEDTNEIKLYVDNDFKANALSQLLPESVDFGNIKLKIMIIVADCDDHADYSGTTSDIFNDAFSGNSAFSYVRVIEGIFADPLVYVVFECSVVQYFNDDLGDAHGIASTLYQDIAKDIFKPIPNVYYCTDIPCDGIEVPFWP